MLFELKVTLNLCEKPFMLKFIWLPLSQISFASDNV